jgi:hypothetical protein
MNARPPGRITPRFIRRILSVSLAVALVLLAAALSRKERPSHGYQLVHQMETYSLDGTNHLVPITMLQYESRQLGVVAVRNQAPAFSISPSGQFAIFAAAGGGCGRLFLFDRQSGKLRAVTEMPEGPTPSKFVWRENSLALDITRFNGETRSIALRD